MARHWPPLAVALGCAFTTALPAAAEEHTGFAVHGGLGASLLRDRDDEGTFKGSDFGYTLGLEYRFVPRFALGFDYIDLGSASDTVGSEEMEVDVAGLDLYARLVFPVSETVEAYGRLGGVHYWADVVNQAGGDPFGEGGISMGGGLDIGRDTAAFRLQALYINGAHDESGTLVTAGFTLRF